ncbi:phosphate propanoyltransferase [Domibacillus sp. A3M-37]|uniref:phosphate propanoyltransferase n=1 Tax=Domibacillus TaxID=1433999 RepID=UPI0020B8F704|nr:phosphate propanoyltransferase [Domibacillus sp. A3M-37]MCP3762948.1 phosphate propanoyltransferase [Domibacillus sp. A3M-37]
MSLTNHGTIPVAVSARHVHLSQEHLEILFGAGHELTKRADLSQPGQFAAEETVTIAGKKSEIARVRVLGPCRPATQVEVSWTDAMKLGVRPPLRESGDIKGSEAVTITGPAGTVELEEGLIIAQAHVHMTTADAKEYNVESGQIVTVEVGGDRPIAFRNVVIRVSDSYALEMHIDTDEANAGFISQGAKGDIWA